MGRRRVRRAAAVKVPAPIRVRPSQVFDQANGQWSTFTIGVGSPPQRFRVLPSTKIPETWVTSNLGCIASDPQNCYQLRGGENFNGNPPSGFQPNASTTWNQIGLYNAQAESYLNLTGAGEFGSDILSLNGGNGSSTGDGVSLGGQVIGAVADKSFLLGYLGLSFQPSGFSSTTSSKQPMLQNFYENKLIPSQSYGYTAGAYYGDSTKQTFGSLTLGGYDATRLQANQSLSISYSQVDSKPLMVGVQSITVSDSLNGTASMTIGTNAHMSLIDSSVPEIWLPKAVADNFASNFGLFYDNNTNYYLINSTMRDKWTASNPSFTFKLGATTFENGNSINIILPYKAFDFQLGWTVYSANTYYFPIRRAANDTQYVLGRTLLQEAYIVIDHDRRNFTLARTLFPDTSVGPSLVPILPPSSGGSGSGSALSAGAIAGIAIGGIAVIILAILAIVFFRRRKNVDQDAKISELEAKHNSYNSTYHKVNTDGLVESGGDELQELPGSGVGGYKDQHAAELESNVHVPVYEMEGDSGTLGPYARSPGISSPGDSAYSTHSPGRPSPAHPSPMSDKR